ncbi:MAG TPA: cupin domain-containing protein, partial [Stellaceae bacterium]|nr:cupin domain-containing protein [Stellaceae bacterium]
VPLLELVLAPGDLLYLPRGYVHSTTTSDTASVHVTLGITVYTWVELLVEWAQSSRTYATLRRALPPGFATSEDVKQQLKERLPQILEELQRVTDYDALLKGLSRRVRSARVGMQGEFQTAIMSTGGRSSDRDATDTRKAAPDATDHHRS